MEESSLRRIEKFKGSLEKLKELSSYSNEKIMKEPFLADALERNLHITVEAIMDVSRKIISFKGWEIPKTYKETVDVLEKKGIFDKKLEKKLKDLIGLRNILVHFYAEVKEEVLLENLKSYIPTLESSMKILLKFCERNKIDP